MAVYDVCFFIFHKNDLQFPCPLIIIQVFQFKHLFFQLNLTHCVLKDVAHFSICSGSKTFEKSKTEIFLTIVNCQLIRHVLPSYLFIAVN